MKPLVLPDLRDGYVEIVNMVRRNGKSVSPRGYRTWEVRDACFRIEDTHKLLPLEVGRDPKLAIGLAEALLLCGGLASPSLLVSVSPQFSRFLDGGDLHGGYGRRIRSQLEPTVRRLLDDRDTRQAIIQIWDPHYDLTDARDVPCTLNFGFHVRDDGLHMSATMRSNDVWLGLTYDAFMFGQLGWTVAKAIGVPLTSYTHHAYSLHLYERNSDDIFRLHDAKANVGTVEPEGFGPVCDTLYASNIEGARARAERIYNRLPVVGETWSEKMYRSVLDPYDRLVGSSNFTS